MIYGIPWPVAILLYLVFATFAALVIFLMILMMGSLWNDYRRAYPRKAEAPSLKPDRGKP